MERNLIIREAGLENLANLLDKNYCIKAIEMAEKLYLCKNIKEKDDLYKYCANSCKEAFMRVSGEYLFGIISKINIKIFIKNPKFAVKLKIMWYCLKKQLDNL